jgi:hypothetical protein
MDFFLRHPIMLLLHIKLSSSYVRPTQGTLRCAPLSNMIITQAQLQLLPRPNDLATHDYKFSISEAETRI